MKKHTMLVTAFLAMTFAGFVCVEKSFAEQSSDWQFKFALYAWYASIGGEAATGTEIVYDSSDLIDDLDFVLMANVEVQKGKLHFSTDVIYLEVSDETSGATGGARAGVEANLQSWVVIPYAGYTIIDSDQANLSVLGGARYLSMDTDIDLNITRNRTRRISGEGDIWDGIIGVKGNFTLSEKWFIPCHLDIGTGESDLTWQAFAGVGYRFSAVDLIAGYRYLAWEFDDDSLIDNLDISGVLAGLKFAF